MNTDHLHSTVAPMIEHQGDRWFTVRELADQLGYSGGYVALQLSYALQDGLVEWRYGEHRRGWPHEYRRRP